MTTQCQTESVKPMWVSIGFGILSFIMMMVTVIYSLKHLKEIPISSQIKQQKNNKASSDTKPDKNKGDKLVSSSSVITDRTNTINADKVNQVNMTSIIEEEEEKKDEDNKLDGDGPEIEFRSNASKENKGDNTSYKAVNILDDEENGDGKEEEEEDGSSPAPRSGIHKYAAIRIKGQNEEKEEEEMDVNKALSMQCKLDSSATATGQEIDNIDNNGDNTLNSGQETIKTDKINEVNIASLIGAGQEDKDGAATLGRSADNRLDADNTDNTSYKAVNEMNDDEYDDKKEEAKDGSFPTPKLRANKDGTADTDKDDTATGPGIDDMDDITNEYKSAWDDENGCFSKFQLICKDIWCRKSIYLPLVSHLSDTATDYASIVEFYMVAAYSHNECGINVWYLFGLSIISMLLYRSISSYKIWQITDGSFWRVGLQIMDVEIFRILYISHIYGLPLFAVYFCGESCMKLLDCV